MNNLLAKAATLPPTLKALIKGFGYYLAYRTLRRVAAYGLQQLVRSLVAAGWFEGVSNTALSRQLTLAVHLVTAAAIVLWFALRRRSIPRSVGLKTTSMRTVALGFFCGCGATVTVEWLYEVVPFPVQWMQTYTDRAASVFEEYSVWTVVLTVIAAPLMEEIVFRGLLFKRLREGMPFWAAAVLSSLVFGAAHATLLWMLYAFVLGLLMAWLVERTGSVWTSILCHFGFNMVGQLAWKGIPFWGYVSVCVLGTLLLLYGVWEIARCTRATKPKHVE